MPKNQLHEYAPAEYRNTERISGDYEFDASIAACKNPDAAKRLKLYTTANVYGYRTNYSGYDGYHGDD